MNWLENLINWFTGDRQYDENDGMETLDEGSGEEFLPGVRERATISELELEEEFNREDLEEDGYEEEPYG